MSPTLPTPVRYAAAAAAAAALLVLAQALPTDLRAQAFDRATLFQVGTVLDVYPGACGQAPPEATDKLSFCDRADNLLVVRESRGLNARDVQDMLPNYAGDGREVYLTREGVSIRSADGAYDNYPELLYRRPVGQQTANDADFRYGFVDRDGHLFVTGGNVLGLIEIDPTTHDVTFHGYDRLAGGVRAIAYDAGADVAYVVVSSSGTSSALLRFEGGVFSGAQALPLLGALLSDPPFAFRQNKLYLGTIEGLLVIDLAQGWPNFTTELIDETADPDFAYPRVADIAADPTDPGLLWLALNDNGGGALARYDIATRQLDTFTLARPDNPALDLRFDVVSVDADGLVSASASNYAGYATLDASGAAPAWTLYDDQFEDLGYKMTYRPDVIHYQDGHTYFASIDGSSSANANYEVVVREADGTWTARTDDVPGAQSAWEMRRFNIAQAGDDGRVWWLNNFDDALVRVDADDDVTGYTGVRNTSSGAVDPAGRLVFDRTGNDRQVTLTTEPRFTAVAGAGRGVLLTRFGDEVWALNRDSNVVEIYVDGGLAQRSRLDPALRPDSYFAAGADASGAMWFYRQLSAEISLIRHDVANQTTTQLTFPGTLNTAQAVHASPDGGVWLVGRSGIAYLDANASDLTIYDRDTTSQLNAVEQCAVDTLGVIHCSTGFVGTVVSLERTDAGVLLDTLAIDGNRGALPAIDFYGSEAFALDSDGDFWVEGRGVTGFARLERGGAASQYVPGAARRKLRGRVYTDINGNDAYDEGEGVSGLVVAVRLGNGSVVTTTTRGGGAYAVLLGDDAQNLLVSLPQLPPFTSAADRQLEVDVPAGNAGDVTGADFELTNRDYGSLHFRSANRTGVWGFERPGFRNAFTVGVTNLSLAATRYEDVEVEFVYFTKGTDAPPLPDVVDVRATEIGSPDVRWFHDALAINPQTHAWSLPGLVEGFDYVATVTSPVTDITRTDDTVRVRVTLPEIAPRATFVLEIETDLFDPVGTGSTVVYGVGGTRGRKLNGGNSVTFEFGDNSVVLYPDEGGEYSGDPGVGGPRDPNNPYLDPGEVYDDPPYVDPSEVYSDPPYQAPLFSSYDPNDKLVDGGLALCPDAGALTGDAACYNDTRLEVDELRYTIRFENTGNFAAKDIYILDTLDAAFEPTSLRLLEASHAVEVDFLAPAGDSAVVRFAFRDIYLPFQDSLNDGWVRFGLSPKRAATPGVRLRNGAAIYFDQNPPIYTNVVRNAYREVVAAREVRERSLTFEVAPNPTGGMVMVRWDAAAVGAERLEVYDALGRRVFSRKLDGGASTALLNLAKHPSGQYFVRLVGRGGAGTRVVVRR